MNIKVLLIPIFLILVFAAPALAVNVIEGPIQTVSDSFTIDPAIDTDDIQSIELSILSDETNPYDVSYDGLVGWWKFDEGSGSNVSDSSINGNHGVFLASSYVDGKYNKAGLFDGYSDCVNLGNDIVFDLSDSLTISAWVKIDSFTANAGIVEKGSGTFYGLMLGYPDLLKVRVTDGENNAQKTLSGYQTDTLYHVVMVLKDRSSKGLCLYVNGVLVGNADTSAIGDINSTSDMFIGFNAANNVYFNGSIDDVKIYNRALSDTEIEQIYYNAPGQLRAKTNSNSTYSGYWNSLTDNPLTVPSGADETISSLEFDISDSIVLDGVTVYDALSTTRFTASALFDEAFKNNGSMVFYAPTGLSYTVYQDGTYYTDNTSDGIVYTNGSDNYSIYIKQDGLTVLTDPVQTSSYLQTYLPALLGLIFLLFPVAGLYLIYRRGV